MSETDCVTGTDRTAGRGGGDVRGLRLASTDPGSARVSDQTPDSCAVTRERGERADTLVNVSVTKLRD